MGFDYGRRYDAKRAAGISEYRQDGSRTDRQTDVHAGEAEEFACEFFGKQPNREIYSRHGDGGIDIDLTDLGQGRLHIDVVHLGFDNRTGDPRRDSGNLIINPNEPKRWADIYLVVQGTKSSGFEFAGWLTHAELIERPKRDFGYGNKFACPVEELHHVDRLVEILDELISPI